MAEKPKEDLTFEQMYGRLEKVGVPEKVTGTPVCRSEREYLEGLKNDDQS
jgi:hypothetical protein